MAVVYLLLAGGTIAAAQNPPAPPPAQPGQPQQGRGGDGGGGRGGRGPIQVMTLTTTAWSDGGMIPMKHAQQGRDVSPPLAWSNVPDDTQSFVLIAHDVDAPIAGGSDDLLHWMLWNIPKDVRSLPEGVMAVSQLPDGTRQISGTGPYYRGPGAPATGPAHHYVFELYALDAMVDVPAVGAPPLAHSPPLTRAAVVAAMAGHIRAKGVLVGLYKNP